MQSTLFIVASVALLAYCVCAPADQDVIQHIPANKQVEPTQAATAKTLAATTKTPAVTTKSGSETVVSEKAAGATEHPRARRAVGGQESDLLPSSNDVDASPFGETSQLLGRGRIRVLPAFLG